MPVKESKKKANSKWDKENMKTISVKLRKEIVAEFYRYAKENNTTAHRLMADFIIEKVSSLEEKPGNETED